jgi:transcriptional regulator with GAF, ATPase, and Fis domain
MVKHPWPKEEVLPASAEPLHGIDVQGIGHADLQHAFRRLVMLYDLGRELVEETDVEAIFDRILASVGRMLNVERGFIAVIEDGRLRPKALRGINLQGEMDAWPVSTTMLKRVLEEGVSILATDAREDVAYQVAESIITHNIRSVVCCPLGGQRRSRGLIYLDNRITAGAFSRSDLEFLTALARYAFLAIRNAEEWYRIGLARDLAETRLHDIESKASHGSEMIGVSPAASNLRQMANRLGRKDVPVLILGETGTGKEVLARLIHAQSPRAQGPFVPVNLSVFPASLVESELFGHEKGAFTGADKKRIGRLEMAQQGTLFLDEVQDIPMDLQTKLLRMLDQHVFERLGSSKLIKADVRIICACNKNLSELVQKGLFRQDLYYRLNAITLEIPPLRERVVDIVPLVEHFLKQCGSKKLFDAEALRSLADYAWPGNVRELKNCVEAIDVLTDELRIGKEDLPIGIRQAGLVASGELKPLPEIIANLERAHLRKALELTQNNNEDAIKLLGISRAKFFQRKKTYGL